MGNKPDEKASKLIGLTDQLLLIERKKEKQADKDLKHLRDKLIDHLTEKIKKASDALVERNAIDNLVLIQLADPWSSSAKLTNPAKLVAMVAVPDMWRAALSSEFFFDDVNIFLIPESYAIAIPLQATFGLNDVYAMVDPEQIVDSLLYRELEKTPEEAPVGTEVLWILEWLDDLCKEPVPVGGFGIRK